MKKILLYMFALGMVMTSFTSCNDDNDELTDSRITYYAVMSLQGDAFTVSPIGNKYTDAGCKATLNGEDYTSKIVTTGLSDININKAGLYTVTYTATNSDGYASSTSRTVAVCDPTITTNMAGTYTTQAGTYRLRAGKEVPYAGYTVKVTKAAPGIFAISDIMGGYYDQRAGYGSTYAMVGYFQLLSDNSLVCLSGNVAGWGDSFSDFADGKYDPATGTISYVVTYASMKFFVTLK
jgi:hypothetical protein